MPAMFITKATTIRLAVYARTLITVAASWSALASTNLATDILNTAGFEAYSNGPLQGQLAGTHLWQNVGVGGSSATVESSAGVGGSTGVRLERAASSDDWWLVSYSNDNLPTSRYVTIDWDMKVDYTGANGVTEGPFFGVETYDDTSAEFPLLLGSLGMDATTRQVQYLDPASGELATAETTVDNGWHHFRILLDFVDDVYSTSVDYVPVYPEPLAFVDGASDTFTDADIATYASAANHASQIQTATAFLDNFVIGEVLPGDCNKDGMVNLADYTVWRNHLGATNLAPFTMGDANGDGDVSGADYTIWKHQLGQANSAAAIAATASVPEPPPLVMLVLAIAAVLHLRRMHRPSS